MLETDLYVKPTDKHLYVQSNSNHPNSVKKAIPYGLGVRIKRICSEEKDYRVHRAELKGQLRRRGYSGKFLEGELQKVDKLKREDLLAYKEKPKVNNKRVPLVITYSRQLPDVHNIVRKHMPILYNSGRLMKAFEKPPLVAYRRDRNLSDILVHGKLNKLMKPRQGKNCGREDCSVCTRMFEGDVFSTDGMNSYSTRNYKGCATENVVYGIYCCKCTKMVYVGETERQLRDRIREHMADIRLCRKTPVGKHFREECHEVEMLRVTILDRIIDGSRYYRLIREKEWIDKLKTESPWGLNKKATLGVL